METEELMVKNMGQIISDTQCLSSKLKAGFETVTAFITERLSAFLKTEMPADKAVPATK